MLGDQADPFAPRWRFSPSGTSYPYSDPAGGFSNKLLGSPCKRNGSSWLDVESPSIEKLQTSFQNAVPPPRGHGPAFPVWERSFNDLSSAIGAANADSNQIA